MKTFILSCVFIAGALPAFAKTDPLEKLADGPEKIQSSRAEQKTESSQREADAGDPTPAREDVSQCDAACN